MKTRTIHHFEDEPEEVRWIAGALLNRFWLNHPDWIVEGGHFKEVDYPKSASFCLKIGSAREDYVITHRLYSTSQEFQRAGANLKGTDIVILDLLTGDRQLPGLTLYGHAVAKLGAERVYVLTALPQRAIAHGVPADHVFVKPVDPTTLINTIVEAFKLGGES